MTTISGAWHGALRLPKSDAPPSALEVCRAFEGLAVRRLAPLDLAAHPFYARPLSFLPERFRLAIASCGGLHMHDGHIMLRPFIADYRGAGPACVVRDPTVDSEFAARMQREITSLGRTVTVSDILEVVTAEAGICNLLVHELAHGLDAIADGVYDPGGDDIASFDDVFAGHEDLRDRFVTENLRQLESVLGTDAPPRSRLSGELECHGLEYARTVAHLDYRLRQLGVEDGYLCCGAAYDMAPYDCCYDALGDEMERSLALGLSFRQIARLPMPKAFAQCDLLRNRHRRTMARLAERIEAGSQIAACTPSTSSQANKLERAAAALKLLQYSATERDHACCDLVGEIIERYGLLDVLVDDTGSPFETMEDLGEALEAERGIHVASAVAPAASVAAAIQRDGSAASRCGHDQKSRLRPETSTGVET